MKIEAAVLKNGTRVISKRTSFTKIEDELTGNERVSD
jgi:hypothetical protein